MRRVIRENDHILGPAARPTEGQNKALEINVTSLVMQLRNMIFKSPISKTNYSYRAIANEHFK